MCGRQWQRSGHTGEAGHTLVGGRASHYVRGMYVCLAEAGKGGPRLTLAVVRLAESVCVGGGTSFI